MTYINRKWITGLKIYTERGCLKKGAIEIQNGIIHQIYPDSASPSMPMDSTDDVFAFSENYFLIPGLIDLHVHGANHHDVMDATPLALASISKALAAEGTTGFLATTMTDKLQHIEEAICAARDFMNQPTKNNAATLLGVHLEGPFISPKKAGAQQTIYSLTPDIAIVKHLQKLSDNAIKLVTLAPELANSIPFIRYLEEHHIIAAMGHSDATYAETQLAIEAGAHYATHLFNAMRAIHQREPGIVLSTLLAKSVFTELIVDGAHLHPAIVELIFKLKTADKMILVTDAMRAKCLSDGEYNLGGQSVSVKQGIARLTNSNQPTLAGSTLKMPHAIKNIVKLTGCSVEDAIKMAAENPAKILKLFHQKGSIAIGKDADLAILDSEWNVVLTFLKGNIIFKHPSINNLINRLS